jgi:hypothetical protein
MPELVSVPLHLILSIVTFGFWLAAAITPAPPPQPQAWEQPAPPNPPLPADAGESDPPQSSERPG